MPWAQIPQEAHASADYTAKHLPAFDPRMASSKSGHPEPNQGPSDLCKLYSQMLYQLSYIAGLTPTIASPQGTLNMLPDAEIYWHLPCAKSRSHFCVCHPCGAMEILRRRLSHLCACHPLRGHGNLARRIKLTRVTKENLQLKILEVKGASCVGDPCNSILGPQVP